jgi:tRNA-specific 2-thiouridylase
MWNTVKPFLENPEEVFNAFRNESILNEERAKSTQGRLDYIDTAIKKLEVAKKRITEAFKAEAMTLQEFRKEKTDIELSEEKLVSERDDLMNKLNIQHNIEAKIDLFKETCHKFLSKLNDPKIVTERLKGDIIKLVIDEVVIDGEKLKLSATIPLPNKIHEREIVKTDFPDTFNAGATLGPINQTKMERVWNKHKQINTTLKPKVFVAMSGGVDSSVAALLLKKQGYDVTGVFMRCYNIDGCAEKDAEDARRVAGHLEIPFYIFDFEEQYKRKVVDYMIDGYRKGITPNPDVMCNKEIKFGLFLKKALELGADHVATGHYVRLSQTAFRKQHNFLPLSGLRNVPQDSLASPALSLYAAKDKNKDQSYFLWTLTQEQLKHCLFLIGDYLKNEVRAMARQAGLPVAEKKDSQGICFLGKVTLADFLKNYISEKRGEVFTTAGEKLGEHKGAWFYTIGQRHIGVASRQPVYVAEKDVKTNTVVVAGGDSNPALYRKEVELTGVNFIPPQHSNILQNVRMSVLTRVRYRQPLAPATLYQLQTTHYKLEFDSPIKFVASGQSAVFYSKDGEMLGGGVIHS